MQNKKSDKMTFQEFLGKLLTLGIFIAIYFAIRGLFEFGLGYKNFPFLLCAIGVSFLIEAIRSKNLQVICTVFAVEIFIATYYVEIAWLEFGMWSFGIVAIIVGMRAGKSCESDK